MKKLVWVAIALAALAVVAIAGSRLIAPPQDHREVTIAQFGDLLLYLPLYVAVDEGKFEERGLDVRVISTGGDDKTYAAVLSGGADFGVADPTFVAIAQERNAEGYVVGLLVGSMANYAVSADPNAAVITDLSQLQGKRFASVPAPSTAYAALAELYRRGGAEPDILQTSPAGLMVAGRQPGVYGSVLIEPWVSQLEADGGRVVLSMPQFFGEFALTGITTSSRMRRDDPKTVQAVREAIMDGVRIVYEDPATALRVAKARFPQESPAALERGIERMRQDRIYPRNLSMSPGAWRAAMNLRASSGDFEGDIEASWDVVAPEAR